MIHRRSPPCLSQKAGSSQGVVERCGGHLRNGDGARTAAPWSHLVRVDVRVVGGPQNRNERHHENEDSVDRCALAPIDPLRPAHGGKNGPGTASAHPQAGSCGWVNMWPACGPWFEDVRADIDRHGADAPGIRSEVLVAEDRQAGERACSGESDWQPCPFAIPAWPTTGSVDAPAPLRVALIGLGDIAAKAYLPVLAADGGVEPVLITRDPARLETLRRAWRVPSSYPTVEDALSEGVHLDAGFVHSATRAHPGHARALIEAGIPTFVDKPLALTIEESRVIVEHARAAGVSLSVLFNRRHTRAYTEVAAWPGLDTVVLTKNRVGLPDDPRVVVFDDFIHVVDTLRFLVAAQPEQLDVVARPRTGRCPCPCCGHRPPGQSARRGDHGSRQRAVGRDPRSDGPRARPSGHGPGRRRRPMRRCGAPTSAGQLGVCLRAARVRLDGRHLLESVRAGVVLDAGDALATHEMCAEILAQVEQQLA